MRFGFFDQLPCAGTDSERQRREYQMDEFICYFNQGGLMDHAMVRQSMTLFATEVLPHCR
jgi:hypothetical protein